MAEVVITVHLSDEIIKEASALGILSEESIAQLVEAEIERRKLDGEDDAAWEAQVAANALVDALNPDGSINFDKLRATGIPMTLEELCPEIDDDDES